MEWTWRRDQPFNGTDDCCFKRSLFKLLFHHPLPSTTTDDRLDRANIIASNTELLSYTNNLPDWGKESQCKIMTFFSYKKTLQKWLMDTRQKQWGMNETSVPFSITWLNFTTFNKIILCNKRQECFFSLFLWSEYIRNFSKRYKSLLKSLIKIDLLVLGNSDYNFKMLHYLAIKLV